MHYIMSDIHGQYGWFLEMLEQIRFSKEDHLYIIGDIIDKGPDSAGLFIDVVSRDNVTLLLGNHEYMMHNSIYGGKAEYLWLRNGSEATLENFSSHNVDIRKDIIPIIKTLPVIIPDLVVNNRHFLLVHAGLPGGIKSDKPMYMKDLAKSSIETAVWQRDLSCQEFAYQRELMKCNYPKHTFIFGHTPVTRCDYCRRDSNGKPLISFFGGGQFINVDCGSALGLGIGCLRLEDMQEFYVRAK